MNEFLPRDLTEAQNLQKSHYDSAFASGNPWPSLIQTMIYEERLRFVQPYLSREAHVLDLGCGNGYLAQRMAMHCCAVTAVDISETAILKAREMHSLPNIHYMNGPIEKILEELERNKESDRYDLVSLFEVIEHLYDPSQVLRLARMIMKPDGIIVITTPNANKTSRRLRRALRRVGIIWKEKGMFGDIDFRLYGAGDVKTLLAKAGFKMVRKSGVILGPEMLWGLQSLSAHRINIALGKLIPDWAAYIYVVAKAF